MFVAEIGSNWLGDIDEAKRLHEKAKWAGATHVKYQLWKAEELYDKDWEFYDFAKQVELDYETVRLLDAHAKDIGLGWFASVHTKEDVDFVKEIEVPFIKIKQTQCLDLDLIQYAGGTPLIISTPDVFKPHFVGKKVYNIFTTSAYPTQHVDLSQMDNPLCDGFSDHTAGIGYSVAAAKFENIWIFERHFKIKDGTPDTCVSITPIMFKKMVDLIKREKDDKDIL